MSRIYWHTKDGDGAELLGMERAYMGSLCEKLAAAIVEDRHPIGGMHAMTRLLPPGQSLPSISFGGDPGQSYIRTPMSENPLTFDGETHDAGNLALNTVCAMGEPLALLAKLHGYCESHAWVHEDNRRWLAGVIEAGRARGIFRAGMGWESVATLLRSDEAGHVVTSSSVCDSFPSPPQRWMDDGWPERERGTYRYDLLTDSEKEGLDARSEAWYDMPRDEQWRIAFAAVEDEWWLRLSPDLLTRPTFGTDRSLWDAVASDEWLGRVKV